MSLQNSDNLDTVERFGEQMGELINLVRGKSTKQTIIERLIDFGFNFANTATGAERRADLFLIALASVETEVDGKMVGLTNENLSKAVNDEVSNRAMLQSMQKGTIHGVTTWRGDASSRLNNYRKGLEKAFSQGDEPAAQNDGLDQVLQHIVKALTALGRVNARDDSNIAVAIDDITTYLRTAEQKTKTLNISNS